jgi:hypothetical protein
MRTRRGLTIIRQLPLGNGQWIVALLDSFIPDAVDRSPFRRVLAGCELERVISGVGEGLQIPSTMRFARSRYLFYLAVAIPPGAMAALIQRYGVNVPVLDEWDMSVPLVLRAREGSLQFAQLWAQQNEHRMLVVNLLTLLLQKITNYNVVVSMYCGLAFEVLTLVLILRILAITLRGADPRVFRPLALCASLIFFWPVAWENWTWGMPSIEFFGSLFWAVAVVWALAEWPGRWLGVVIASAAAILGLRTAATGFPLLAMVILGIPAPTARGTRTPATPRFLRVPFGAARCRLFRRIRRSRPLAGIVRRASCVQCGCILLHVHLVVFLD